MRLLLDECVVRDLKTDLVGHDVSTVIEAGFGGLENGELLRLAAAEYDVLITVDRNLPFQHNIAPLRIAVLLLPRIRNYIPGSKTTDSTSPG